MKKLLPLILSLSLLVSLQPAFSQTTYNFNSGATLSAPIWSFWKTRAVVTIDGVRYQMDCGGNGSFANSATEGVSNSASLKKDGSGGDQFTLQREDGQPFQFYGFWIKHQSMNSYSQFMSLPPWYTITYNLASGGTQTDRDMTAKQGNNTALTTSAITYTKNLAVTSVSIQFNAIMYFWIDDIKVGPVAAVAAPTITAQPNNRSICSGGNTTFSVTATDASSYQWQVNTGSGFSNISNNSTYAGATTNTLTVTSAFTAMNGYQYRCVVGGSSSVNSNSATLTVSGVNNSFSLTNIACNGTATGAASISVSGGVAPYTYLWSNGATSSSVTGLAAGAYSVTATDVNGCSTTRNFTITQPTAINVTSSQTNVTCNGGSNGTARVTVTGGYPPYSYSWAPYGGTSATASGLTPGNYTVTITDDLGCQTTRNFTITQPAAMQVGTSQTNIACNGGSNGSASVTVSGGTAPYTYQWSNGATSATAAGLAAGTYSVTITDANGCQVSRSFTLTQPVAIQVNGSSQTNVTCNGGSNGSASVTVSGGAGPYFYSWAPMGGTAATATGLAAGTYTVTITDQNSCQTSRSFTITQPTAMQVNTSQTNIACNGGSNGSAIVTVSGGTAPYTYQWSNGATSASAAGLAAGTYSVTITDANGCQATRNFTLTQPTAMQINGTSQTNVSCNGASNGSASVTVSGGTAPYTYSWAPMGGTASTATGLAAGSYTVTITDANACQTTRNFTITQPAAMQVNASQTNVSCFGKNDGTAAVTVAGGTAPYTYIWSNGATTPTASGLIAGTYSVTITDANGCQSSRNFTITQPAAVTASVNKTTETICSGSSTSIELTGSNGTSFNWTVAVVSGNVAGYSNGSGETIFQTLTGNGKINYTITPSNGICTGNNIEVSVTVNALTSITTQPIAQSIEEEESTSFEIAAANATSYQWQVNTGNGFVNLSNDQVYSGVNSSKLMITSASGELDGSTYRCIATGLCAPVAISDAVSLDVNVKATQSINFESIPAQIYGEQYSLQASSNSGLAVAFSSSDPSIAEISNGILYAKKAGQVTITASQPGNEAFKPAPAVDQLVTIQKRTLTIERNTTVALEKTYDGNHLLTLPQNALTIQNTVNGDVLEATAAARFESEAAGTNKAITIDNFQLTGNNLENYQLTTTSISATGSIKKKTISAQIKNNAQLVKTYDGSSDLELESNPVELTGLVGLDEVFVQTAAAFDNKDAGPHKTVTLSLQALVGNDKDNYELSSITLTTTGTILPKMVNVTQSTQRGLYKTYDGTTTMNPNDLSLEISGTVAGDELSVLAAADFESKNVGSNIPVDIHSIQLDGKDKDNYQLTSQHTTAVGTIEPYVLTLTFSQDFTISKIYDGTTKAAISKEHLVLPTLFGEDEVNIELPASASYDNKNAGTGKQITVEGISLSGKDAGNYTLEAASVNGSVGTILPKAVSVKASAATKVYGSPDPDFSFTTEGVLEGETLEGKLSRMEGKNVGVYDITIGSLTGGSNYTIESFEKASLTITKADLLIKANATTKIQGQRNPAFTLQYIGLAGGDKPSDLSTEPIVTTNAVTNSPIGIFEIKVEGAASPNYNISYQNGALTIAPASSQNSVQAWSSGSGQLQVRIYADRAQKASIVLYTVNGQTLILEAKQLNQGINTFTLRTGHLTTGTYILGVYGQYFKEADKLNLK